MLIGVFVSISHAELLSGLMKTLIDSIKITIVIIAQTTFHMLIAILLSHNLNTILYIVASLY
jgi:hypothetical protein